MKLIKFDFSQNPRVEIKAAMTIPINTNGPNIATPPTAKPPVVKNITRNPKNDTPKAITPCTLRNANATPDSAKELTIPIPNIVSRITTRRPPIAIADVTFQGTTTKTCHGKKNGQQHRRVPMSVKEVNRKQKGEYAMKFNGKSYQNHSTLGAYSLNFG